VTAAAVRCGIGVATSTNEAFFEVTAGRLQAGGGRRDSLKKRFVYQSTGKHDELKTSVFQGLGKKGKVAGDLRFSL